MLLAHLRPDMEVHDEFVPEATFRTCLEHLPQVCIEVVLEREGAVLLARRTNEPARGEFFWPGGRLYKGEKPGAAAHRVAREELGIDVELQGRIGVYNHFWDTTSVEGLDSRHTVNLVYHARQVGDDDLDLDEQHDEVRWVEGPEPDLHEYVRQYLEEMAFLD
jgi:colanic acid biosynthesis protein WcaH